MEGCFGRYLHVNLSEKEIKEYPIPQEWYDKHLGGRGIAARIFLEEQSPGVDPLSPENMLVFATGPFQGTNLAGAGRHLVMSRGPRTGTIAGSYAGGFFAHELGTSGYDGIIFVGKAGEPVYLSLIDGEPSLQEASDLWGLDVGQTTDELVSKWEGSRVSAIGQAGENEVSYACIMNYRNRAAGRPGFGAVMGSKDLKAVVVRGNQDKPVSSPDNLKDLRGQFAKELLDAGKKEWGKLGTTGSISSHQDVGSLPTKNFREGKFEGADKISGERQWDIIAQGRDNCTGCPIRCKRVVETNFEGQQVKEKFGGPEYETSVAFGSYCMNDDIHSIALANQLCNQYGMDTISTGVVIGLAMEASENGLLEDEINWGDSSKMIEMIEKIAHREGIGDLMSQGAAAFAEEIGADEYAMHIKGQEIPMHDPREKKAFALSYATTPRGANHMEGVHDTALTSEEPAPELGFHDSFDPLSWDEKAKVAKAFEDLRSFSNSLILCAFTANMTGSSYNYDRIREIVSAVTGKDLGVEEMMEIGERNYLLLRILSGREGHTIQDDGLPSRFEKLLPDQDKIPEEELRENIKEYYRERGYDDLGPTEEKLEEIGLDELKGAIPRK